MKFCKIIQIYKPFNPRVLFLLLILITGLNLFGENKTIGQILSVNQGLPQNNILSLEEDKTGYVWIGTQAGLSQWDGENIRNYSANEMQGFPKGYITQILKDSNDRLWLLSEGGELFQWDNQEKLFLETPLEDLKLGGKIRSIHSDPLQHDLLIFTDKKDLLRWSQDSEQAASKIMELQVEEINVVEVIDQELLLGTEKGWIGLPSLENSTLSGFMGDQWSNLPVMDSSRQGQNLITTRGVEGITRYDLSGQNPALHYPVHADRIEKIFEDDFLILQGSNTLLSLDSQTLQIQEKWEFQKEILDIKQLQSKIILIQTRSDGLWVYDPYALNVKSLIPGLDFQNSSDIMSLFEDKEGKLWMAGYDGGLYLHDNNSTFHHFSVETDTLPSDNLKYVTGDNQDNLWIASYDSGFFQFNTQNRQWSYPQLPEPWNERFRDIRINHIYIDTGNKLWLSTEIGLFKYYPESGYFLSMAENWKTPDLNKSTWCLMEDREGIYWVATDDSLLKISPQGEVKEIDKTNHRNWFLYQDSLGLIFSGSPSGLKIYNREGEAIRIEKLSETLETLAVYGVLEDRLGSLWITTNQGVYRWERNNNTIQHFDQNHGLLSKEFNLYSLGNLNSGDIYLGGIDGVDLIHSLDIKRNPPTPILVIDSVKVNDSLELLANITDNYLNQPLSHKQNKLTFNFNIINFVNGKDLKIEYRLLGLNDQWIDISNESSVSFISLAPGKYQFELRVKSIYSNEPEIESLHFIIEPPFFRTIWFMMSVIFLFITAIYIITRSFFKLKKEIKKRIIVEEKFVEITTILEDEVSHRTEELEETLKNLRAAQKQVVEQEKMSSLGQVVAGVAHEINTPLGIAVLSNSLLQELTKEMKAEIKKQTLTKEGMENYLKEMNQAQESLGYNLDRAATLVQNFKQVAVEKNQKEIIEFDLCSSINSLLNSLQSKFKKHKITVKTHFPPLCNLVSYPGDISQVVTNIMMNSLIHGFREPYNKKMKLITLALTEELNHVILRIRDNGSGIAEEVINQIYEPFFTTNREEGGTGLGMHIVYNIIKEKLKGDIDVESTPGKGTEFILTIPKETK